jgi:uncharacterized protein (TIRG00374 family)
MVQALVTLTLLFFLFRNFDWGDFRDLIQKVSVWFYLFSLLVVFAGQLLYTLRWRIVLRSMGMEIPYGQLVRYYLIGTFFNNFLPTAVGGDGAKIYYLGRQEGYFRIGGSVFLDRFFGFFAMTAFATLLSWCLNISSAPFIVARNLLTVLLVIFVLIVVIGNIFPVERLLMKLTSFNSRLASLGEALSSTIAEIKQVSQEYAVLTKIMAITLVYFVLLTWVYYTFFQICSHNPPSYWATMAILFGISVLANIPITVNGIGLREQLHYFLLASLGLSKEISVTISFLIFSNILFISLVGYFLWVRLRMERSFLKEDDVP